jgi:proteasome lid subunit RPN8/RPN11
VTLVLADPIRDAICAHARSGAPREVVGVLAGDRREGRAVVRRAYRAENAADDPRTRYEIAAPAEIALLERIDDAGLDVVGFYHSHPEGPPGPSDTDARLAAWPGRSYVIVSLGTDAPETGAWRWDGDRFVSEPIERA